MSVFINKNVRYRNSATVLIISRKYNVNMMHHVNYYLFSDFTGINVFTKMIKV